MKSKRNGGFTMIELLTVLVLVAVLAAIAIPSYSAYVKRGQRAAAKAALQQAAQFLERNYTSSGCYNYTTAAECSAQAGVPVVSPVTVAPTDGGPVVYNIAQPAFAPPAGFAPGQYFSVTATPTSPDPDCGALTMDNTGQQCIAPGGATTCSGAGPAAAAAVAACWQR